VYVLVSAAADARQQAWLQLALLLLQLVRCCWQQPCCLLGL
jgi:hypothetical protein